VQQRIFDGFVFMIIALIGLPRGLKFRRKKGFCVGNFPFRPHSSYPHAIATIGRPKLIRTKGGFSPVL